MSHPFLIAIDGPAAAGKGTLARRLATHYNLAFLDTGLLYRAVAYNCLSQGIDLADESQVATTLNLDPTLFESPSLRDEAVSMGASMVATYPSVRQGLVSYQRQFAADSLKTHGGVVLDGRDIGTSILPHAPFKFFITATLEARAKRRFDELQARGQNTPYETVLAEMKARDARDQSRSTAPLKPALDAIQIDTSALDKDQVFEKTVQLIDHKRRVLISTG